MFLFFAASFEVPRSPTSICGASDASTQNKHPCESYVHSHAPFCFVVFVRVLSLWAVLYVSLQEVRATLHHHTLAGGGRSQLIQSSYAVALCCCLAAAPELHHIAPLNSTASVHFLSFWRPRVCPDTDYRHSSCIFDARRTLRLYKWISDSASASLFLPISRALFSPLTPFINSLLNPLPAVHTAVLYSEAKSYPCTSFVAHSYQTPSYQSTPCSQSLLSPVSLVSGVDELLSSN